MRADRTVLPVVLLIGALASGAEFPTTVSANRCKGTQKILGYIDDPFEGVRKFTMSDTFYRQNGDEIYLRGCKPTADSSECRKTFEFVVFIPPGFTGELPCPFIYFETMDEKGIRAIWYSDDDCLITVTKYDETRRRMKGTFRARMLGSRYEYAEVVGCFRARRERPSADAD